MDRLFFLICFCVLQLSAGLRSVAQWGNHSISLSIFLLCLATGICAQTVYVDAIKGAADAKGTLADPLVSLEKAIALASGFAGDEPIAIKVAPGLYTISHRMDIRTGKRSGDTPSYTIEATCMPDDPGWQPATMPVIQSISSNNSVEQFPHCADPGCKKQSYRNGHTEIREGIA